MKKFIVAITLVSAGVSQAQVAPGKEAKPAGKLVSGDARSPTGPEWSWTLVRATGMGAPDLTAKTPAQARIGAENAAKLDALRNLLTQVQGIRVSGDKKMGDLMARDEIRARVEGLIRGYRVAGKRYFSDASVEIDIEASASLLTEVFDADPLQVPPPKVSGDKVATGLVIDARGLSVTPALAPRVLDANGKAVYSVDTLSPEWRGRTGVVSYVTSLEEAGKSPKAGDKPLTVKAAKVQGTDVVLSTDEATRILGANASYLAEGKVVIVMN